MLKLKHIYENTHYSIYLDMDGVICDFAKAFKNASGFYPIDINDTANNKQGSDTVYSILIKQPIEFWSKMSWTNDGKKLWNYIKNLNVCICSTPMDNEESKDGKKMWCRDNLGAKIKVLLTPTKEQYAGPSNILIDDKQKNIDKWIKAGGIGILHKNTESTIKQLSKLIK